MTAGSYNASTSRAIRLGRGRTLCPYLGQKGSGRATSEDDSTSWTLPAEPAENGASNSSSVRVYVGIIIRSYSLGLSGPIDHRLQGGVRPMSNSPSHVQQPFSATAAPFFAGSTHDYQAASRP